MGSTSSLHRAQSPGLESRKRSRPGTLANTSGALRIRTICICTFYIFNLQKKEEKNKNKNKNTNTNTNTNDSYNLLNLHPISLPSLWSNPFALVPSLLTPKLIVRHRAPSPLWLCYMLPATSDNPLSAGNMQYLFSKRL